MSKWLKHEGSEVPLGPDVIVEVELGDGTVSIAPVRRFDWDRYKNSATANIMWYRIVEENVSMNQGHKHDTGKARFSLIPLPALQEVMKVLEHGAEKYEVDNWKRIDDFENRYYDAIFRHLFAYKNGEVLDKESGINHLAHAACGVLFLLDRQIENRELK